MSYLQLDKGVPDFSKLVLSLWFRVPQASINAASASFTGNDGAPFDGIIPLVVMGKRGKGNVPLRASFEEVLAYEANGFSAVGLGSSTFDYNVIGPCLDFGPYSSRVEGTATVNAGVSIVSGTSQSYQRQETISPRGPAPDTNPFFIGLDCFSSLGFVTLFVNFETAQVPVVSGYGFNETITPGESQPAPNTDSFLQGTRITEWCSEPFGLLLTAIPGTEEETFNNIATVDVPDGTDTGLPVKSNTDISDMVLSATGAIHSHAIEVTGDHWHHLLVSVDLQTIETHGGERSAGSSDIAGFVDSASKLFVALDDVNYTGHDLTSNWSEGDPNGVITDGAREIAEALLAEDTDGNVIGTPHYMLASPKVPSGGEALGLPATTQFVDKIRPVELAELQIFTGVSIDTGVTANRRAFIDKDGNPVSPVGPTPLAVEGEPPPPPDPGPAETLLGKKPVVLLHGAGNWIAGRNTGGEPSGSIDPITGIPTDKPGEDLTPTGWIINYTPEPSLNGPQMPDAEPAAPARETVT